MNGPFLIRDNSIKKGSRLAERNYFTLSFFACKKDKKWLI